MQYPDHEVAESIVERWHQRKQDVRDKWSKMLDNVFESSATAKEIDSGKLEKIKEEVTANLLQQVEGVVTYV
ncbi:hypothetical protein E8E11_001126 [Didymella keratinophila]|nr:hypothetical protein E8E11_001126 [Didymella keratinophila]